MSTADLYADLIRRAEAYETIAAQNRGVIATTTARCEGKAAAYRHAAELLRGAVAAAVEEEREAIADLVVGRVAGYEGESIADAIRARGESPRGDAASDGREGAE